MSPAAVREYKLTALAAVDDLAALLTKVLPQIGDDGGFELVAATTMLAAAMWPIANPPAALAALYEQDPALAHACVDFAPTLNRLVTRLIAGYPAA